MDMSVIGFSCFMFKTVSYLIFKSESTHMVALPLKITVTKTTISTDVNIIWRETDSVLRMAKANATAPRKPSLNG